MIRGGRVATAPHFDRDAWRDYSVGAKAAQRFGKPARLLNDAEVQGLGIVAGHGLEVVLTLGTGIGSAVFSDGRLAPHLELGQHPVHNGRTYDEYIGNEARLALPAKWGRRVLRIIGIVYELLHYDMLYLGGGNAAHVAFDLPENLRTASNDTGLTGGIHLWDDDVSQSGRCPPARRPDHLVAAHRTSRSPTRRAAAAFGSSSRS